MVQPIWKPPPYDSVGMEDEEGQESLDGKRDRLWSKVVDRLSTSLLLIYETVPWRHILPLFVLILYTVFGGWLFRHLEVGDGEDQQKPTWTVNAVVGEGVSDETSAEVSLPVVRRQMAMKLRSINGSAIEKRRLEKEVWDWYDKNTVTKCMEKPDDWSMWNSMFFAATLYTTIGYGHVAPRTTAGRVATMIYAMIGIPLVLTILSSWGNLLFDGLKGMMRLYTKIKHRRNIWIPMADLPEGIDDLPVAVAIFLLIFWICTCAGIFLIWERWDYFTSLYFFFISLTTIGLGDVVPEYPQYTLMSFVLVLLGLSVVSMSFNIIQVKIENVFKSMMMGIEQEYWQKQVEPETSRFGEDGMNASVGVMQLWRKKPLRERILFRLMDKSKKDMLCAYWEKRANTRNQETQTPIKTYVTTVTQVDMEEEEFETKYKNRKYVYNLAD